MPSYNTGDYICESIESVLNQTYKNWELIIVDDCSTDDTEEKINPYLKYERIHFYKNSKNQGAATSRNLAIQKSKGEWIAFLDSDDIWNAEKLEKQLKFMKENDYSFSYTKYETMLEDGKKTGQIVSGPKMINKRRMYNFCYPGCLTVMYNQNRIGEIQIANLPKNNDYAIWLKAIRKADCYLLNENLAKYRLRKNSISREKKLRLIKHHYYLYRIGEERNAASSLLLTVRNLFFGVIKKIKYTRTTR